MRSQIIFRGDGNQSMGLGHMFRLMALWEIQSDSDKIFVIAHDTAEEVLPKAVKRKKIPVDIKHATEPAWLAEGFTPGETTIVLDGYQFDSAYLEALRTFGFRVIYIDDLVKENNAAHVIINHAIGIKASDYKTSFLNQFGLGTKYAMLRPAFLKRAGRACELSDSEAAFVCFGGSDSKDLTGCAVKALLEVNSGLKINVVVGAAYKHTLIDSLAKEYKSIIVHRALEEERLAEVMLSCSFGLVSASTIAYEACALQLPVMAGYYVDNQKQLYQGLVDNGLVVGAGDISHFKHADFKRIFVDFLSRSQTQLMKSQATHFDAGITQRISWLFKDIAYRTVTANDVQLVYDWANDPLIRANSYQTEAIPFEGHKTWFNAKLQDKNCLMFVCEYEGQAAGMLRYQASEDKAVVGIQIGEGFRGKKLAVPMLIDTARFYFRKFSEPIFAYIKVENEASKNAFEKAGYKYLATEVVNGFNSYCYRLEKLDV